ncbi:hypothetical protein J6590_045096, partial [Homalodisca vitripennis]
PDVYPIGHLKAVVYPIGHLKAVVKDLVYPIGHLKEVVKDLVYLMEYIIVKLLWLVLMLLSMVLHSMDVE